MYTGISNPFLGLFTWFGIMLDTGSLLWLWLILGVAVIVYICKYVMGVDRELVHNGLYPASPILTWFFMIYFKEDEKPVTIVKLFLLLVPMTMTTVIVFQGLCEVFVKKLGISPCLIAANIVLVCYSGTQLFLNQFPGGEKDLGGMAREISGRNQHHGKLPLEYLNAYNAGLPRDPNGNNPYIGQMFLDVLNQAAAGVSAYIWSDNKYSCILYTVGLLITSPILACTWWSGAILACVIQRILLRTPSMADGYQSGAINAIDLGVVINGEVVFSVLVGQFFLLNKTSILFGVLALTLSNMAVYCLTALFGGSGLTVCTIPSNVVIFLFYLNANTFPDYVKVELENLTVPEDHLRRWGLSVKVGVV